MLVIGEQEESAVKTYVGLFDDPIRLGTMPKKHSRQEWIVEYILILEG